MSYEIIWEKDIAVIEFTDVITVKEISLANKYTYGDPRLYKTKGAIFDFSKSHLNHDEVEDNNLRYFAAVDLGAATTIKAYKLALVVATQDGEKLVEEYINLCKSAGSPWQFRIFYDVDKAYSWVRE